MKDTTIAGLTRRFEDALLDFEAAAAVGFGDIVKMHADELRALFDAALDSPAHESVSGFDRVYAALGGGE